MTDSKAKAIGLMVISMFAFASADTIIKVASSSIALPQITLYLTCGAGLVFTIIAYYQKQLFWTPEILSPVLIIRYIAETVSLFCMVHALANAPLSTVGAIIQAVPLIVTFAAVLFLKERVSWRRWTALIVGFLGVLLIIQPGAQSFEPSVLWAFIVAIGLAVRDLTTRSAPKDMSTASLSAYTMYAAIPFIVLWNLYSGEGLLLKTSVDWILVLSMSAFGSFGYLLLTTSVRLAEISVVSPYRYARLLFMLIFGMALFNERPDALMLTGAALIVTSGIYIMWRERVLQSKQK